MSTLQQIKSGLHQAWDSLLEGWQHLYQKATGAITRFKNEDNSEEEARSTGWGVLAAELVDDQDQFILRLEAPGMEPDQFDLQVIDNILVIRGHKQVEKEEKRGHYHIMERAFGYFERAIPLPEEVLADQAQANYKRGVLVVKLPKKSSQAVKKINVKVN